MNSKIKIYLLKALTCIVATSASAMAENKQNQPAVDADAMVTTSGAIVQGVVISAATGERLADVHVTIRASYDDLSHPMMITGSNGRFSFRSGSFKPGESYTVEFSYVGFKTKTVEIHVGQSVTCIFQS